MRWLRYAEALLYALVIAAIAAATLYLVSTSMTADVWGLVAFDKPFPGIHNRS